MSPQLSARAPRRVTDPGAPELRADVVVVLVGGAVLAASAIVLVGRPALEPALLGLALVAAELVTLRLVDGREIPASDALVLPLFVAGGAPAVLGAVVAAHGAGLFLRRGMPWRARVLRGAERASTWAVGYGIFRTLLALPLGHPAGGLLLALVAAAAGILFLDLSFRAIGISERWRLDGGGMAALAVGTTGLLMALALRGVEGRGDMGLWGVAIFTVPLLAARFGFGRLHAIHTTYDQTIEVLSVVPEMGGWTRPGHSRRVADLSVAVGRRLGLDDRSLHDLERAALLHALGHVALDDPDVASEPRTSHEVARTSAAMLLPDDGLSGPARLLALTADGVDVDLTSEASLAALVLKASSAFEAASGGDPANARSALDLVGSSVGGVHDRTVLDALEHVILQQISAGDRA